MESPVRRTVKPAGLPAGADEAVLAEARKASGYVPELARLMGIPIPPPARAPSTGPGPLLSGSPAPPDRAGRAPGPTAVTPVQVAVHGEQPALNPADS